MAWTKTQTTCFLTAARQAGWNDRQRHMAMKHAGCPHRAGKNPSVKSPGNTNTHFRNCMELAEAAAAANHRRVTPPGDGKTWASAARQGRSYMEAKAREIAAEAITRLPAVFDDGLLDYAIKHTAQDNARELPINADPRSLEECDGGQLYRIVEMLKAFVGRAFDARAMTPRSFDIPASVRRRRAHQDSQEPIPA